MRRSAYLLALLGMAAPVAAQDVSNGLQPRAPLNPPKSSLFAAPELQSHADAPPQRYMRAANPPGNGSTELHKYYSELMQNGSAPGTLPKDAPAQKPVKPALQPYEAAMQKANGPSIQPGEIPANIKARLAESPVTAPLVQREIIQAEFEQDAGRPQNAIQQVSGERFQGLPHPGANPAAGPGPQPAPTALKPFSGASLTDPINVGPQASPFQSAAAPAAPPAQVARNPAPARAPEKEPIIAEQHVIHHAPSVPLQEESSSPKVTLRWGQDSVINVGQESHCSLIVKNAGSTVARDLEVFSQFPASVRLTGAVPATTQGGSRLSWQLNELRPGEERKFEITFVPTQRGEVAATADVRFSTSARSSFAVAEPLLAVELSGPNQLIVGEPASHTVTVTNPGTGIANQVQIEAHIPAGLEHARGEKLLMDLGSLNPGESRSVRLALTAIAGGRHKVDVQARAESGLLKSASSTVNVIAPSLATVVQGPALRYLGRQGTYVVKVGNDSAAATDNVQVRYKIPAEFEYVGANLGAQYDSNTRLLTWFVGRLEQRQTAELQVTLVARQLGQSTHAIRATSEHGALSDSEMKCVVEGTSSLSIQVTDQEDPIEVGSEVVYEVRVRNEGSAAAKAVGVACEMAPGTRLINVDSPTEHRADKNYLVFRPVAELPAGQSLTFKVKVAAAKAGSLRFRAQLSSESISEPLLAEELTKFYGE